MIAFSFTLNQTLSPAEYFFDESNFSKPRASASFCENAVISRSVLLSLRKVLYPSHHSNAAAISSSLILSAACLG